MIFPGSLLSLPSPVKPSAETLVLARFEPELPAITQHQIGRGKVVWCSVPVDRQWSNWTASPLYLPVMQQMAADMLGQTGEGPVRQRVCGSGEAEQGEGVVLARNPIRSPKAGILSPR